METERLKQFCTIVETGSLTQAATVLGISLSGISKSMQALQDDLGFTVFQPDGRGVAVTDLGREVYLRSQEVLRRVAEIRHVEKKLSSSLRVGGMEVFTHSFLGRVLYEKFQNSKIEILELGAGELERALLGKEIDLGITYFPQPHEGIEFLKIKKTKLKAFRRKQKGGSDLVTEPFEDIRFVSPLSSGISQATDLFDQDGWPDYRLPRNHGLRTNRLSTAISLVFRSNYAIFIPQFLADSLNEIHDANHQLQEISLSSKAGKVSRDVFLVKRKSTPEDQTFKYLAKKIRQEI